MRFTQGIRGTALLGLALTVTPRPLWAQLPDASDENAGLQEHDTPAGSDPVREVFTPRHSGLTADLVARRAAASSNTIAAKNAELRAAAAKVDSAMIQFLPRVSLKAGYTRVNRVATSLGGGSLLASSGSGPYTEGAQGLIDEKGSSVRGYAISFPVYSNTYSLGASLSVPLSDYVLRIADSIRGTKLNREASELDARAERAKVEGDARVAFFNWSRALGQVAVTEKSLERVQARLKDVQSSFAVGMVTKASLLRMEAQVAATVSALEAAKGFRDLAEQQLAVIMHDRGGRYVLGEDVLVQTAEPLSQPVEELVSEAERNRLELKSLERTSQSLKKAESVVAAGRYPRIDGFADYTYANPNQRYMLQLGWKSSWAVGLQATWTLNDILANNSSMRELRANREATDANRDALSDGIRLEVTSAYTDQHRACAELEAAQRSIEASQAAYDTSLRLYKVGKATTTELIDAEADLVSSHLRLINAQLDVRVAETKLAHATGRDVAIR